MKRHPQLQDLSREHHAALKLSRAARLACESLDASQVAILAQRVVKLFANELEPHFCAEEQGILLQMADAGELALVQRTLAEHADLRRLVNLLAVPDAATLLSFADLLAAHVRFEERELFAAAQSVLFGDMKTLPTA